MDPASKQLIRESRLGSTPLRQPAAHGTPRSTKSVRFSDIPGLDVATESAGLLASARSKRTQAPPAVRKLKRPTTTEGPKARMIDDPTLAGSPQIKRQSSHTHRDVYDMEPEEELEEHRVEHPDIASPPAIQQSSARQASSERNAASSGGASGLETHKTVAHRGKVVGPKTWSLEDRHKLLALRQLECTWHEIQEVGWLCYILKGLLTWAKSISQKGVCRL
jgi:hypothetical protein